MPNISSSRNSRQSNAGNTQQNNDTTDNTNSARRRAPMVEALPNNNAPPQRTSRTLPSSMTSANTQQVLSTINSRTTTAALEQLPPRKKVRTNPTGECAALDNVVPQQIQRPDSDLQTQCKQDIALWLDSFDRNDVPFLKLLDEGVRLTNNLAQLSEEVETGTANDAPSATTVAMNMLCERFEKQTLHLGEQGVCLVQDMVTRARAAFFEVATHFREPTNLARIDQHQSMLENAHVIVMKLMQLKNLNTELSNKLVLFYTTANTELRLLDVLWKAQKLQTDIMLQDNASENNLIMWYRTEADLKDGIVETQIAINEHELIEAFPLLEACSEKLHYIRGMIANKHAEQLVAAAQKTRSDAATMISNGDNRELYDTLDEQAIDLKALLDEDRETDRRLSPENSTKVANELDVCWTQIDALEKTLKDDLDVLIKGIEANFTELPLSTEECLKLKNFMETKRDELTDYTYKSHFMENLSTALDALKTQLTCIKDIVHLQPAKKQSLAQWCSRLSQHDLALNAPTTEPVKTFASMLINTLEGIANGSPALAEDLISAVHDPACTDWGSKILLDMQAIMLSHTLSDALLEHLSTSPQSASEARLTQLEQFIKTHQKDFCALLNYSAFQSAANNTDIIDANDEESIEAYLLLYLDAKKHFSLPGKLTAARMNYVDYTIEHVLGGNSVFTEKRRAIGAVLRGAQGPLKEDHLNHLSDPFNLKIWNHVIAALPDNDIREAAAKSKRSKLSAEMAALYEAHHNGQLSAKDYTAQSNVLMERYDAVARQTDQIHKQYVDRLMAHITNPV